MANAASLQNQDCEAFSVLLSPVGHRVTASWLPMPAGRQGDRHRGGQLKTFSLLIAECR